MNLIKYIRSKTGLSQSQFASKYDIPVRTLQGWEAGKHVPNYVIQLLNRCVDDDFKNDVDKMKEQL